MVQVYTYMYYDTSVYLCIMIQVYTYMYYGTSVYLYVL